MSSKYKQVKVNFKPNEFQRLEEVAEQLGLSKAELIRQQIGANFDNVRNPKGKSKLKVLPPELLYNLKKIGTNINQIALRANTNKVLDREILIALVRIEDRLKEIL